MKWPITSSKSINCGSLRSVAGIEQASPSLHLNGNREHPVPKVGVAVHREHDFGNRSRQRCGVTDDITSHHAGGCVDSLGC